MSPWVKEFSMTAWWPEFSPGTYSGRRESASKAIPWTPHMYLLCTHAHTHAPTMISITYATPGAFAFSCCPRLLYNPPVYSSCQISPSQMRKARSTQIKWHKGTHRTQGRAWANVDHPDTSLFLPSKHPWWGGFWAMCWCHLGKPGPEEGLSAPGPSNSGGLYINIARYS